MSEDIKLKLFVGGLSVDTEDTTFEEYFKQFGEIAQCKVMREVNGKSRGFGFVTYADKDSFDECLERKDHQIDGKVVEVKLAVPKNEMGSSSAPRKTRVKKIFLGGLSQDATKEQIIECLEKTCCEGCVQDVSIMTEKGTEKPRGFGFAVLKDPHYCSDDHGYDEAAYEIVDKLLRENKFLKIGDRDVEIKAARSLEEMKRDSESKTPRPSYGNDAYGYGRGGGMMYPPRNMYESMRGMSSAYYGGGSYDYLQQARGRDYMSGYPSSMYDRTGGSGYGYDPSAGIDYSKYYSQYSSMMGSYPQSHSNYGPARGYGDYKDRGDRGGDSRLHPYRR